MNTTHTNDFLCKMFAAYMCCQIENNSTIVGYNVGFAQGIQTSNNGEIKLLMKSDKQHQWISISNCKLILAPLRHISDEHAIEVTKLLIPNCFLNQKSGWKVSRDFTISGYPYIKIHHPKKVYTIQIDPILVNFDVDNMEDRETGGHDMKPASIIDFLRSKSYDCGFMEIPSLIEAGLALFSVK